VLRIEEYRMAFRQSTGKAPATSPAIRHAQAINIG
jgi:hypothetical protein